MLHNCRHFFYFHFRYARAFHLRMVQRKFSGRAFHASQRVHLGTHETFVFSHAPLWRFHLRAPGAGISLPNIRLPLGHTGRYFCYPGAFLHLFWNPLIFYISVVLAFSIVYVGTLRCQQKGSFVQKSPFFFWLLVFVLAISFMIFTIHPPSLGIFQVG